MTDTATGGDDKKTGGNGDAATPRSTTSYPAHGLEEAIRFAVAVQTAGGNEASADDVRTVLGLRSKTSAGWSYRLSNAREFGLIDRSGRAEDTRIRLTELFKRYAYPTDDAEKRATLMAVLMRPPLYARLIEKFRGAPVPTVDGVANLLVRDYGIIENMKSDAAKAFIASLRFAGAITQDNRVIMALPQAQPTEPPQLVPSGGEVEKPVIASPPVEVPLSFVQHTFPLRRDTKVTVALPADLNLKDVERLYRWLQTLPIEDDGA